MALGDELKAQILRYHFVEHWRVGTIARQLGVHHSTVERVLGEAGVQRERRRPRRPSKLDPYLAFITECCLSLCFAGPPRYLTGLFRRRIAWDDGTIREGSGAGEVAFAKNRCC